MKIIDENKNPGKDPEEKKGVLEPTAEEKKEAAERERRIEEYKKYARKKMYPNWLDILAIIGIILAANLLAGMLLGVISIFVTIKPAFMQALSYALAFGLAIIFTILLQRQRGLKKNLIKLNIKKINLPLVLWGVALIFVLGVVIEPLLDMFPSRYLDFLDSAIGTGGWAIVTTVVMAPILEEILFRGLILEPIREKSGALRAVLISAAIFGVIHIIPQQAINAFLIGIILGYIYIKTRSLASVIVIHAINNALAYILRELFGGTSAAMTTRDMIGNDVVYYIIYGACVIMVGIALYGMIKTLKKATTPLLEEGAVKTSETSAPVDNNKE